MAKSINLRAATVFSHELKKSFLVHFASGFCAAIIFLVANLIFPLQIGYLPAFVYVILLIGFAEDLPLKGINNPNNYDSPLKMIFTYIVMWILTSLPLTIVNIVFNHSRNISLEISTEGIHWYFAGILGFYIFISRRKMSSIAWFVIVFLPLEAIDILIRTNVYQGIGVYCIMGTFFVIGLIAAYLLYDMHTKNIESDFPLR